MEPMKAWQCVGCGRIEASETCIGICQDVPVQLVYASDYQEALAQAAAARERAKDLESLLRQLAWITPREGEWERSYRALQTRARDVLARYSR